MKAPICNVCLKSDVLCSSCEEKLENGEVTELEVKISRILKDLSNEYGSLRDSEIRHVYDTENVLVIVTAEGDGAKVVGRGGEIVKQIADRVDKSIRVVESSENDRETIKGLLSPAEIKSINTVFKPDGQSQKIIVSNEYKGKINLSMDELKQLIGDISGNEYEIAFEQD